MRAAEHVIDKFWPMMGFVKNHCYQNYWLKGGRGSTKSSFVSICVVMLIMFYPYANAVIMRRVASTIRDSVYTQILWAIDVLGVYEYFRVKQTAREIVYLPTGQKILFKGTDDPQKLKSIKAETGYFAIVWFEELAEFAGIDQIRNILLSLLRGGSTFWVFYSYNPPQTSWSWVNREVMKAKTRNDTYVIHSSYLDVMQCHPEWLGDAFFAEADYVKETNRRQYDWMFLGDITGTGGMVFENVVDREVTDDEIASFDNPRLGVDWGWFPDPWRFVRCEWQASARRLIIYGEDSANRKLPKDTGRVIIDRLTYPDYEDEDPVYHRETIWCDDTPDGKVQMRVYRDMGIHARPARKGNMRKLSYQFLQGLNEIVIDPVRCPLTLEEFALCEYDKDRDGNWVDDFKDGNDHSIDAVRYALMEEAIRGR